MVNTCAAYNCTNRFQKGTQVSFHKFPLHNPSLLKLWVKAIRRKDFRPTSYHRLCSDHFEDQDFLRNYASNYRYLRSDAVPTKFNFPEHLIQKRNHVRRTLPRNVFSQIVADAGVQSEREENPPQMRVEDEHSYPLSLSDTNIKRKLDAIIERKDASLKKCKTKLSACRIECKRQKMKVSNLKDIITDLEVRNMLNEDAAFPLNGRFSDVALEIFKRLLSPKNMEYSNTLKSFALTLYFYSPDAYEFVRKAFESALPHQNTLQKWYNSVDGMPEYASVEEPTEEDGL